MLYELIIAVVGIDAVLLIFGLFTRSMGRKMKASAISIRDHGIMPVNYYLSRIDLKCGTIYSIMKKVVFDTNIIIAGLMSKHGASFKLLRLVGQHHFDIVLSVPLVLEYESVAKRLSGSKILLSDNQIDDVIDYLCKVAIHQSIYYLWRPILKDPQDDHVLEVAVNSNADAIITFNTRDFANADPYRVSVLEPKAFLKIIGALS